jgi:hypothetical protein
VPAPALSMMTGPSVPAALARLDVAPRLCLRPRTGDFRSVADSARGDTGMPPGPPMDVTMTYEPSAHCTSVDGSGCVAE